MKQWCHNSGDKPLNTLTRNKYSILLYIRLFTLFILLTGCDDDDSSSGGGSAGFSTMIDLDTIYEYEAIGNRGNRVYRFTTTTAGSYTISLTNFQNHFESFPGDNTYDNDLSWTLCVYDETATHVDDLIDYDFTENIGDQNGSAMEEEDNITDEVASVELMENTDYFLVIDEWSNIACTYTLQIIAPSVQIDDEEEATED